MSNTSEAKRTSSDLSQWVEDFYHRMFFQASDEVSATAMNEGLSEGFTATINHDTFPRQTYIDAILKFRLANVASVQSTKEIKTWEAPDKSGGGCVAQTAEFTDTNKETGVASKSSMVLVANVKVVDGKRVLAGVTEVVTPVE